MRRSSHLTLALTIGAMMLAIMPPAAAGTGLERDRSVQLAGGDEWEQGIATCSIMSVGTQDTYGWGCFKPVGDLIRVHDNRADGRMVGVKWKAGKRKGLCYHSGKRGPGFESEYFVTGTYQCNKNLPESTSITFRIGRCKVRDTDCSKLKNWRNWGPSRTTPVDQDKY